jgi:RNA polymerase sigma-70 factor (ECF subfamily)
MGHAAIADSWLVPSGPPSHLRYVPTRVNGQLALGVYREDRRAGAYLPICLDVLAVRDGQISDVVAFDCIEEFSRFGLPARLPLGSG